MNVGEYPLAEVLMISATFLIAVIDNLIQNCFLGNYGHTHNKSPVESRAELLGNRQDDEESNNSSERTSIQLSIEANKTEVSADKSSKVTKLIIGLSLHSCE